MAKRMAAQQRGLLIGLIASIFIVIGLAVLLVLEMGKKKEAYLMFDSSADDPVVVQQKLEKAKRELVDAGIQANTIYEGVTRLIEDQAKLQQQVKNLAQDISGKSAPGDIQGAALASWAEQVHNEAMVTLDTRASDLLTIVPPHAVPTPGATQPTDVVKAVKPANLVDAIALAETHLKSVVGHYQVLKTELESARNDTSVANASLRQAEAKHSETVAAIREENTRQLEDAQAKLKESQDLAANFEREQEATRRRLDETIAEARKEQERLKKLMLDQESQIRKVMAKIDRQTAGMIQVDGRVISIQPGSDTAYINLGRGDGVFTNLTFAVFDRNELGKDEPQPKGFVRIVSVLEGSSECRVVNHKSLSPIVKDDVLVNLAYDSSRKFTFALVGRIDINGDGRDDKAQVTDMIRRFGGEVVSEPGVEVDYVVVGGDPLGGMRGGESMTAQEQARLDTLRKENEIMVKTVDLAQRVMIPVLNQNRFLALVGIQPRSVAAAE